MKIDIPYKFGQSVYLKNDIDQVEYLLSRIILERKGIIILEIMAPNGDFIEVPEIMIRGDKDILKTLDVKKENEGED